MRQCQKSKVNYLIEFQSTHPRGMRRSRPASSVSSLHFNPRIRVGCDSAISGLPNSGNISIHASAWDATLDSLGKADIENISIHASAWDATICDCYCLSCYRISIHASAWDATSLQLPLINRSGFQSTHPRGMRLLLSWSVQPLFLFQSTHPRGMRRSDSCTIPARSYFNPRIRVGCDFLLVCNAWDDKISIHASAWDATKNR